MTRAERSVDAASLFNFDVDDGYAAFVTRASDGDEVVAMHEPFAASLQVFDFGTSVNQLQLIYRAN